MTKSREAEIEFGFDEPCQIKFAVELGRWDVNSDFWTLENLLNLNEIAAKSQKRSPLTSADDDSGMRQRKAMLHTMAF